MVISGKRIIEEKVDVEVTNSEFFEALYKMFGLKRDMMYLEKDDKKVLQPVAEGIYECTDTSTHGSPLYVPTLVTTDKAKIEAIKLIDRLEEIYAENMITLVGRRKNG